MVQSRYGSMRMDYCAARYSTLIDSSDPILYSSDFDYGSVH